MTPERFTEIASAAILGAIAGTMIGGFGGYVADKAHADAQMHQALQNIRALALADCEEETPLAPCASPRPKPRPTGGE